MDLTEMNRNESMLAVEQQRAEAEIKGQIAIAKKFPRDKLAAWERIKEDCARYSLAEKATYRYPRGGQTVTGPSIRLAEMLAKNYGNVSYGIRELSQQNGESIVQTYCWDMESNVRAERTFKVTHERHTRKGTTKLTDPRDIYELVANNGARRLRACIQEILPIGLQEDAVKECQQTLHKGLGSKSKTEIIKEFMDEFKKFSVTKEMIETRLNHKIEDMNGNELVEYKEILNSLKNKMSSREDWFKVPELPTPTEESKNLTDKLLKKGK